MPSKFQKRKTPRHLGHWPESKRQDYYDRKEKEKDKEAELRDMRFTPGATLRDADGTRYEVQPSGAWKKIAPAIETTEKGNDNGTL